MYLTKVTKQITIRLTKSVKLSDGNKVHRIKDEIVEADVYQNVLAIHKSIDYNTGYTVTHIPTQSRVYHAKSKKTAQDVVKRVLGRLTIDELDKNLLEVDDKGIFKHQNTLTAFWNAVSNFARA